MVRICSVKGCRRASFNGLWVIFSQHRYQALVGGSEPLQSYLHKRLAENLNSEAALGTVCDVAQCVQWLRSTFLCVRAAKDPKLYLGLPSAASPHLITKKIEELCVQAMNCLASSGLITMDEASCIESTEAGRLMSIYYLDLETMKHLMKIEGSESLERLLWVVCESHELADMHLRVDERRCLNALNRNTATATVRFPMKGKISSRQMKLNCMIQAILGCLPIPDPSLNQEAMKIMRIAARVCKCLVSYVTRPDLISKQPQFHSAVLNSLVLAKCIEAHLWENSPYVSKQLKGIGQTFSALLATAGKVNFMLLEESHPRDLERIMNKGAPAGNIIRKQVSLLPKYQLTVTPVDEKKVCLQLTLLNKAHLAENMDQLTGGQNHKCHVIVGDSENHLLLLTSFSDKDLISVYDGSMTYEITRKHNFEHKILFHCISTTFVGIDAQCEYLFKNVEPLYYRGQAVNTMQDTLTRKTTQKQITKTEVYKERKRKNNDDIAQSKEKKKRDNALIGQLNDLRESFGIASKELKEGLHKSSEMSNRILESFQSDKSTSVNNMKAGPTEIYDNDVIHILNDDNDMTNVKEYPEFIFEDIDVDGDNFTVDDRIDNILNEIEHEISESRNSDLLMSKSTDVQHISGDLQVPGTIYELPNTGEVEKQIMNTNIKQYSNTQTHKPLLKEPRKRKTVNIRSNYDCIDSLEKKANLISDDEDLIPQNDEGFLNTIRSKMEKFLQKAHNATNQPDVSVKHFVDITTDSPHSEIDRKYTNDLEDISIVEEKQNEPIGNETTDISVAYINTSNILSTQHIDLTQVKENSLNNQILEYTEELQALDKHQCFGGTLSESDQNFNTEGEAVEILVKDSNNFSENIQDEIHQSQMKIIDNTHTYDTIVLTENEHTAIANENNPNKLQVRDSASNQTCNVGIENEINSHNYRFITPSNLEGRPINIDLGTPDNFMENKCNEDLSKDSRNGKTSAHQMVKLNKQNNTDTRRAFVPLMKDEDETYLKSNIRKLYDSQISENYMRFEGPSILHLNMNKNSNVNSIHHLNNMKLGIENHIIGMDERSSHDSLKAFSPQISDSHLNTESIHHGNSTRSRNNMKVLNLNRKRSSQCQLPPENTTSTRNVLSMPTANNRLSLTSSQSVNNNRLLAQDTGDIEKDEYINKYSFTTTKIDVCTKSTPDHQYQVIRRLKLDLDVTEIVSKSKTKVNNNESDQSDGTVNMTTKNFDTQSILSVENSDSMPMKAKYVQNLLPVKYIEQKPMQRIARTECYIRQPKPSLENDDHAKEEIRDPNTERMNSNRDETKPKDSCTEKVDTDVENVLEKYSLMLRKNNNRVINNNISAIKNLDKCNETKPTTGKLKIPYKISNIRTSDIILPKSLIVEAPRIPRPTKKTILTQIKAKHSYEEKPNRNHRATENLTLQHSEHPNIEIIVEEIHECPEPIDNLLNELTNSPTDDIDQTMFDPKTLLQYCCKEPDEIIPPPLEFCDGESIYTPTQATEDSIMSEELSTEENYFKYGHDPEVCYEGLEKTTLEMDHDRNDTSIFKDNPYNTLTPSKEIETWTLSPDKSWETSTPRLLASNPMKSCTVMRNNSPKNKNTLSTQNLDAIQAQIGHFKFMRKQKFKM